VFDHSWGLLSAEEREVLRKLSVFRGGFRREAADAVAGASLFILSALVDRSWIRNPTSGRYEMHELVRQYCLGKLDSEPDGEERTESDQVQDQHSRYYGAFLRAREERLHGREQAEALREILEEIDNVWAAWRWAVEGADIQMIDESAETLAFVGEVRGWYREVQQALELAAVRLRQQLDVTAHDPEHPTRGQATVVLAAILPRLAFQYYQLGLREQPIALCEESLILLREVEPSIKRNRVSFDVKARLGHLLRSEELLREALTLADHLSDSWRRQQVLFTLGVVSRPAGRYTEQEGFLRQAIAIGDETGEQRTKASSLDFLSHLLWARGEYQEAEALAEESLRLRQELGDRSWIGFSFVRLGEITAALGKYELAAQHFQQGYAIGDEINYALVKMDILNGQGRLALVLGQYAEAKKFFGECLRLSRETVRAYGTESLVGLGHVACALGELQQAGEYYHQALEEALTKENQSEALYGLMGVASLSAHEGWPERGVELLALVVERSATYHVDRTRAQELLCELQSGLSPEIFAAAVARGQARELEDVAAEILAKC